MDPLSNDLPIIWVDQQNFHEAVFGRIFNHRRPNRHPLAVVHVITIEHIKETVKLANQLKCQIAIRSGGHSWAAWSVRDSALLIDLGALESLSFDAESGIVKVAPATTAQKLDSFLSEKGRIFPGPHCPSVGLGGFLLQGGIGWNCRAWGWAAEHIVGMEVVTAKGKEVYCSKEVNPDLFWSARGSGPGFFAVVTKFHLQTMSRPAGMLASTYIWDISEYDVVMTWILETSRKADPDIEITAVSFYPDPETPILSQRIQICVHLISFRSSDQESRSSLELFAKSVPNKDKALTVVEFEATSLANEFLHESAAFPENHRYCVDNAWIKSQLSTQEIVSSMREIFTTLPSAQSSAMYFNLSPAPKISEMALSLQTEHWLTVTCAWKEPEQDRMCQDWLKDKFVDIGKVSPGLYIGDSDFQVRKAAFMQSEKIEKLNSIRKVWDPNHLFCSYLGLEDDSSHGSE